MSQLRDKRIEQTRRWIHDPPNPLPALDWDEVFPITVYEAVLADFENPGAKNLRQELDHIYSLINRRQEILPRGLNGSIMIWTGVSGRVGSLGVSRQLSIDVSISSHARIPTERAVVQALASRVTIVAFNQHTSDLSIHITDAERNRWNDMTPLVTFRIHVNNTVNHISQNERLRWNNTVDIDDFNAHIFDFNNPHQVTPEQLNVYTIPEVDAMFQGLRRSFFNHRNINWNSVATEAQMVDYHPANSNPHFIMEFDDVMNGNEMFEDLNPARLYFAVRPSAPPLEPLTDNQMPNIDTFAEIWVNRPGQTAWEQVLSPPSLMRNGDVVTVQPDTAMYVWMYGEFIRLFPHECEFDPGDDGEPGGGIGGVFVPFIRPDGFLEWSFQQPAVPPPLPNAVRVVGQNGVGVPVGGANGHVLTKLSGTDFHTAWESIGVIIRRYIEGGGHIPIEAIHWNDIVGRPNTHQDLGNNTNDWMSQAAITTHINGINTHITNIWNIIGTPGTLPPGMPNDLWGALMAHINHMTSPTGSADNNPHGITPGTIGAVTMSAFTTHIQHFNNPHMVRADQVPVSEAYPFAPSNVEAELLRLQLLWDQFQHLTGSVSDHITITIDPSGNPRAIRAAINADVILPGDDPRTAEIIWGPDSEPSERIATTRFVMDRIDELPPATRIGICFTEEDDPEKTAEIYDWKVNDDGTPIHETLLVIDFRELDLSDEPTLTINDTGAYPLMVDDRHVMIAEITEGFRALIIFDDGEESEYSEFPAYRILNIGGGGAGGGRFPDFNEDYDVPPGTTINDDAISEFMGMTTNKESRGNSAPILNERAESNRIVFIIPFKSEKSEIPNVVVHGTWRALMGDNSILALNNPWVRLITSTHALIEFNITTVANRYPTNSPCFLMFGSANARIEITTSINRPIRNNNSIEVFRGPESVAFNGMMINGRGGPAISTDGEVQRFMFTLPFKNVKNERVPLTGITFTGSFRVNFPNTSGAVVNGAPQVVATSRTHAIIVVSTSPTVYPSNTPCTLELLNADSTITVTPTGDQQNLVRFPRETFTGNIGVISEFKGITTLRGNTLTGSTDGNVNSVEFVIPFKHFKANDDPSVAVRGNFMVKFPNGEYTDLAYPEVSNITAHGCLLRFRMDDPYPNNSPCILAFGNEGEIEITPA